MIDCIVDAQESVVHLLEGLNFDGLVLGIMLRKVEQKLLRDVFGVYSCRYFRLSFIEYSQYSVVHIVVEENYLFLGRSY